MEGRKATDTPSTRTPGITPSERYLTRLARRSFLSLWSYANLFTDEGRKNGKGDGKELCDLMVVFDNQILLFSDKHCAFPDQADIEVAWGRWYKRAVEKSTNQLFGAESWLRRFPDRVFLDSSCSRQFPLPIPDVRTAHFHRLAVTRGANARCRDFFGGQSTGSLVINTRIQGPDHLNSPFSIGRVAPTRGYVHVLDELTLEVVLRELDTISDLVEYLQKKEEMLSRPGRVIMATGEEQLVAMYLTHLNKDGEHDFVEIPGDVNWVAFDEGWWEGLIRNPQYTAKKEADRVSYAWDRLIEHFISSGGSSANDISAGGVAVVEPALRVLASEPRLRRRQLAVQLLDVMKRKVEPGQRLTRLCVSQARPDTAYLFLILPKPQGGGTYEDYREGRKALLLACCKVAKLRAAAARRIVGIATEPAGSHGGSEDLVLLETAGEGWTPTDEKEARELQELVGILREGTTTYSEGYDKEFPDIAAPGGVPMTRRFRRAPQGLTRSHRRVLRRKQRRKAKRRAHR